MNFRDKKPFVALGVVLVLTFALQKVFSLSLSRKAEGKGAVPVEKSLLLTETDGLLSEKDATRIFAKLETPMSRVHQVGSNEWLEKIAQECGVPAIFIRSTNNLEDPLLRPRQEIIIQNKKGMVHLVRQEETLNSVIAMYEKMGAKRENILAMNSLDELTYQKDGMLYLVEGSKLWIPDARRSFPFLARPVNWLRISSRFGSRRHPILGVTRRHDGYDLVARYGAPVYAGQSGVVTFAGVQGGYGNMIELRHSQISTRYGHLSQIYVQPGQTVKKKQLIGRVGSTGISTGPHLHFEVRRNSDGKAVRPGRYLY